MNKYNHEGYPDPTAYGAFTNMEKAEKVLRAFRPFVYICSASDDARNYTRFAVDKGFIPLTPQLMFFFDESDYEERFLKKLFQNIIMSKCAEVWVFGEDESLSEEIKRAKWKNYRLKYFTTGCEEVLR